MNTPEEAKSKYIVRTGIIKGDRLHCIVCRGYSSHYYSIKERKDSNPELDFYSDWTFIEACSEECFNLWFLRLL